MCYQLVVIVHDEDVAHVQLDAVALLRYEEVEECATEYEEKGVKAKLNFCREVLLQVDVLVVRLQSEPMLKLGHLGVVLELLVDALLQVLAKRGATVRSSCICSR
eukprot:4530976-Heterocapsa_arctica.AAC.1